MSLAVDGVWKAAVWAPTVWADGVWAEGGFVPPTPPPTPVAITGGGQRTNTYAPGPRLGRITQKFHSIDRRIAREDDELLALLPTILGKLTDET